MELATPQFWVAALEIVAVNVLLSGDNAVVIALACRNLPPAKRSAGIFWGVVAVVALRVVLTSFAAALLELPYLRLAGAALLLWIGIRLAAGRDADDPDIRSHGRLLDAMRTIVAADLAMSFDNVIAVAGVARGTAALVVGLAISIPLVVVASRLIMTLIERFPWLVIAGGALLGYVAGELATGDPVVKAWIDFDLPRLHSLAPIAGIVVVAAAAWWTMQRRRTTASRPN